MRERGAPHGHFTQENSRGEGEEKTRVKLKSLSSVHSENILESVMKYYTPE